MMKKRSDSSKKMVYSKLILGILVSLTFIVWAIGSAKNNKMISAIFLVIIALTIVILFVIYASRELKSVRKGLPVEDERSKKILRLAFAKAYLLSLYLILAIGWLSDEYIRFRDVSQATGAIILGMAILFGLCWIYYNNRGDL